MSLTNLIDTTYFIDELSIPNIRSAGTSEKLGLLITKYQESVLKDALGEHLYLLLDSNYDVNTQDKWYKLINGDDYSIDYNGKIYNLHWRGLVNDEKQSLLAYFVFYYLLRDHQITFFGTGVGTAEGDNVKGVSASMKLSEAWNGGLNDYGRVNNQRYSGYSTNISTNIATVQLSHNLHHWFQNGCYVDRIRSSLFNYIFTKKRRSSRNLSKLDI